mmetsp:Transcript_13463/g.18432  ORF Transcript_13463/g.18432 Transcript_13463/m.18432 type:complete len:228 (+) Transcript_13463:108-791(+)
MQIVQQDAKKVFFFFRNDFELHHGASSISINIIHFRSQWGLFQPTLMPYITNPLLPSSPTVRALLRWNLTCIMWDNSPFGIGHTSGAACPRDIPKSVRAFLIPPHWMRNNLKFVAVLTFVPEFVPCAQMAGVTQVVLHNCFVLLAAHLAPPHVLAQLRPARAWIQSKVRPTYGAPPHLPRGLIAQHLDADWAKLHCAVLSPTTRHLDSCNVLRVTDCTAGTRWHLPA